MDVESQYAMVCRTRILEFKRKQLAWSNRGRSEINALKSQNRADMQDFTDYWYNHPKAGFWFNAPFLAKVEAEPETKLKSTIPSVGQLIAPDLYLFDPSNPEEPIVIECRSNYYDEGEEEYVDAVVY